MTIEKWLEQFEEIAEHLQKADEVFSRLDAGISTFEQASWNDGLARCRLALALAGDDENGQRQFALEILTRSAGLKVQGRE